jgi:hypothetical protein
MGQNTSNIMLTFEVEEFDVPLERGLRLPPPGQMSIAKQGLDITREILDDNETPCTLFTTANFALRYPSDMKLLPTHFLIPHLKRRTLKIRGRCWKRSFQKKFMG